jgi:hypothetical protein
MTRTPYDLPQIVLPENFAVKKKRKGMCASLLGRSQFRVHPQNRDL